MRFSKILATIPLFLSFSQASADDGVFFVGAELGSGRYSLDESFATFQDVRSGSGLASAAAFGYRWENNLLVEANIAAIDEVDIFEAFDDINLNEFSTFLGYSFQPSTSFHIVPMIGINRWELKSTEGRFLNPGDEESSQVRGTDFIYKVKFEVPISENIQVYLSYSDGNYDYVDSQATRLGIKVEF